MMIEAIIWGLFILLSLSGLIWATVSKIRREKKEEKFEERDN